MPVGLIEARSALSTVFPGASVEALGELLWQAKGLSEPRGTYILSEGASTAGVFFILMRGTLRVTIGAEEIAKVSGVDIVGEMAIVSNHSERTASVTVDSDQAELLRCHVQPERLDEECFAAVRRRLRDLTWDRRTTGC